MKADTLDDYTILVDNFIFCSILTEVINMNNVDEVIQVISIGLIIAGFLLNTNRFLKAIELCKECLFILKDTAGLKDKKMSKSFFIWIYFTMHKTLKTELFKNDDITI